MDDKVLTAREEIVKLVSEAMQALAKAHITAMKANPLADEVPILRELSTMSRKLGEMLKEINRLRGLQ